MKNTDSFVIEGLGGRKILEGAVNINGAKNAALKAMAAAVLFDGPVMLTNIPDTDDIHTQTEILRKLGATVSIVNADAQTRKLAGFPADSKDGMSPASLLKSGGKSATLTKSMEVDALPGKNDGKSVLSPESHKGLSLQIDASNIHSTVIDPKLAATMRASVVLTGPLLSRFGKATFPAPGGCVIGARPIDQFLKGYEKMGATVNEPDGVFEIVADSRLRGAEITFDKITVGGTETLMMAAVLADGKTKLENCAKEPEIVNVAEWLNACGADIKGVGTDNIEIIGTNGRLLKPVRSYVAIPDRIEAGSFLILGAACAKDMTIDHCRPDHLTALIEILQKSGVTIETTKDSIHVKSPASFKAFDVETHEYPGFPTDLQAPLVTFLTQADGESTVTENIFEGRFKYVDDLVNMGANIEKLDSKQVCIKGPTPLDQLPADESLCAHDIRAGFAMVMTALIAKGKFTVTNVHLIDRGYEKLEERLTKVGAVIQRTR